MPLSEDAFPYVGADKVTRVHDGDQDYEVDGQGNVLIPGEAPENPFWDQRAKFKSPAPAGTGTVPAVTSTVGTPTSYLSQQGQQGGQLPPVNVQPGLSAQQWEATYALSLAQEKRLREIMETIDQPKARAAIDEAIQAIAQTRYANQVSARESQAKMTGRVPQWLPQIPKFQPGAWKGYQAGGLVAPPGSAVGAPTSTMSDDQAAPAIWNADQQLQSLYKANHPEMSPIQAVQDWWTWAPHEGAMSLADYARKKGYLNA